MAELSKHTEDQTIPFFPDHVKTELRVIIGVLVVAGIIGGIALFRPVGLGDPADPMNTPAHVKPEWYFLALYQLLKFIPKTAGTVIPVLGVLLMIVWPFIDRKQDRSPKVKVIRFVVVAVSLVVLTALTFWGGMS